MLTEGAQVEAICRQHIFHLIIIVGFIAHYQRDRRQVKVEVTRAAHIGSGRRREEELDGRTRARDQQPKLADLRTHVDYPSWAVAVPRPSSICQSEYTSTFGLGNNISIHPPPFLL